MADCAWVPFSCRKISTFTRITAGDSPDASAAAPDDRRKLSGTGLGHCCAINATTTASRGCGLPRVLPLPQRSALAVVRWLHHVSTPKTTIDYTATADIALISSARRKLRHDCHIV